MNFIPRRSEDRGNTDHGWLKTFHTFSSAMYQPREFEIFSYIIAGKLEHNDSMGNSEILKRGDVQLTSAGTGVSHSEKAHGSQEAHSLQIWSLPQTPRLTPKYFTRHFPDDEKKDKWARVVAPVGAEGVSKNREGQGPAPVQSALTLYSTILSPGMSLTKALEGQKGYIQIIQTSGYNDGKAKGATVRVSSQGTEALNLAEGDGAYIKVGQKGNTVQVDNISDRVAEILLFDLE